MTISNYGELKTAVDNWLGRTDLTSRVPEFIAMAEDALMQKLRIRGMEAYIDLAIQASVDGGTVGGTANAITLTPSTAITAYALGQRFKFTATATNTSSVTVAISGLAATAVNKGDGTEALEANDILDTNDYHVLYDGTRFRLLPAPGAFPLPSRYIGMRRIFIAGDPQRPLEFMPPMNFHQRFLSAQSGKPFTYTIEGEYFLFGPTSDASYQVRVLYWRRFPAMSADSDTNWIMDNARGLFLFGALLEAEPYIDNDSRMVMWAAKYTDLLDAVEMADVRDRHSGAPLAQRGDNFGI